MGVRSVHLALAGAIIGLMVLPAEAQRRARTVNNLISRPSTQGPSAGIGGQFTHMAARPLAVPRQDVATIGENALSFYAGSRQLSAHAEGLQGVQIGLQAPIGRQYGQPLMLGLGSAPTVGYGRLLTPGLQTVPAVDAYLYSPKVPTTRFQDLAGLVPASSPPSLAHLASYDLPAEIEAQTTQRVDRAERAGLALFKEATVEPLQVDTRTGSARYPNCPDCMQTLGEAASQLRMVESLKSDAFLPSLLLAHAALEQERPMTAVAHLTKAFERDPSFIEKRMPIAEYFGDVDVSGRSDYLESQMLRFVQMAELNPESPTAQVLSAYCAWRLGDTVRAREAARRAQELARQDPETQQSVARLAATIAEAR